jgi:peptidyl-prolyl cis-trans isomerase B (cyclophilin B)
MIRKPLLLFLGLSLLLSCCKAQSKKDFVVTISTRYGNMVAILYDDTPKHKQNFIKLAREHYFDSLLFHRVIKDFMIQGGDPDSKKAGKGAHLGQGGPGYTIDAEFNPRFFHEKGALSAARLSDQMNPTKASSGSQFYIVQGKTYTEAELKLDPKKMTSAYQQFFSKPENKKFYDSIGTFMRNNDNKGYENYIVSLKPVVEEQLGVKLDRDISLEALRIYTTIGGAPHLDGQYTVFGKIIQGLEVIDKIALQPKDQSDRPLEDIRMAIKVEELPKKKIEKLYGYHYQEITK